MAAGELWRASELSAVSGAISNGVETDNVIAADPERSLILFQVESCGGSAYGLPDLLTLE